MSITTVDAGDSRGTAIPRRQYNYVLVESKKQIEHTFCARQMLRYPIRIGILFLIKRVSIS